MKSKLDIVHFAAVVERYTTPLLEDSMGNKKEVHEMNTKHTPGPWCYEPLNPGSAGSRREPPDPGHPAFIWADTEHGEIPIATLDDPIYRVDPEPFNGIGWPDDGVRLCGNMNANAALIVAAPRMATELARGRVALCALRYWVPEDLLPAVNRVIVNMAHAIGKATGDCPSEADGRIEEAARVALEEAAK